MPLIKTILKKTRQHAVVELVGEGASTIDLAADLKMTDETFRGYANCNVHINGVMFTVSDTLPTTITRNSSNVLVLLGSDNWSFSQQMGFAVNQNNTSNISVTIPGMGGTVVLSLSKVAGYAEPEQQVKY
jgi:hypothetical protein